MRRPWRRATAGAILLLLALPLSAQRARAVRPADDPPALWLAAHAIPLGTTEPTNDDSDLSPVLDLVRDARVIALGDATHGTHEFFSIKQRLIPFLIRSAGVRTVIFEAPYAEFERVGDWIRTGNGDLPVLLESADYWFWDTDEVLSTLQWIRAWNASGNPPVEVAGVDAFHPQTTAQRVIDYLRRVDPPAAGVAMQQYACILDTSAAAYSSLSAGSRASCQASIVPVRASIESRRTEYAQRSSVAETEKAIHAARVVEQGEAALGNVFGPARDEAMAENIAWLAERATGRVLVWGHNEHLGKTPFVLYTPDGTRSVGTILSARYGNGYAAIATTALSGFYHAMNFAGGSGTIGIAAFSDAGPDDYATFFRTAGRAAMIVPLRAPLPTWLLQPHTLRIAGSSGRTSVALEQNLAERFDAVIYVENSTPTRLRHFPTLR